MTSSTNGAGANSASPPVTLDDVARLSGVSRATASRALNGRAGVSPDVRERVRRVGESLDYRPNRAARNLASGRASVIGFVMPSDQLTLDPYGASLVQALAGAADAHDEGLMLMLARDEPNREVRRTLVDGLVDGVVVSAVAIGAKWVEELLDAQVPTVLVGAHPTRTDVTTIEVENLESSASLVEHLFEQGHERIATIAGLQERNDARQRLEGYRLAHERRGVEIDERLIVQGDFSRRSGQDTMRQLLELQPDAVVAANDEMAMGAMRTIEIAGLAVPDDIALVGFDGTSDVWGLEPSLTSVSQPFEAMAELAVSALIQMIAGEVPPVHQLVIPELVLGRSSQRPRGSSP
ncbi:MAG: LacI family DNA-binding transcriptional regulator [Ilumatobacteraceae bacterium]